MEFVRAATLRIRNANYFNCLPSCCWTQNRRGNRILLLAAS